MTDIEGESVELVVMGWWRERQRAGERLIPSYFKEDVDIDIGEYTIHYKRGIVTWVPESKFDSDKMYEMYRDEED
jgi:hypothetical protein